MKHKLTIFVLVAIFLLTTALAIYLNPMLQLKCILDNYNKVLETIPSDLTLTIYYLPPEILTRVPLSTEALLNMEEVVKIVVKSDRLVQHLDLLKTVNSSNIRASAEEYSANARFYYVFETESSGKMLEVVMQQFTGDDKAVAAFVNGIKIEKNPVLFEIIIPFLSDEESKTLGVQ